MKVRICICTIIFLLCSTTILVNKSSGNIPDGGSPPYLLNVHTINVSIDYSRGLMGESGIVQIENFVNPLNYSWIVDDDNYVFKVDVTNISVLENYDELKKYDVLVESGIMDEQFWAGLIPRREFALKCVLLFFDGKWYQANVNKIKTNLEQYIYHGGGYVGHCGGGAFPLKLNHTISDLYEKQVNKRAFLEPEFHKSTVNVYAGYPIFDEHFYWAIQRRIPQSYRGIPELIGQSAFVWYVGTNTSDVTRSFGGAPVDLVITDTNHPIFRDYLEDTWRVRWGGGPSFSVEEGDTNVSRLTYFPADALNATSVIAWRFPLLNTYKPDNPLNCI